MAEISSPLPPVIAVGGGVEVDDFAFHVHQPSSPHSLKHHEPFSSPPAPPLQQLSNYNYNFSSTVYDESSSASASNTDHENDDFATEDDDGLDNDDPALLRAYGASTDAKSPSVRSSISSLPGSILPDQPLDILSSAYIANTATPLTPVRSANQRILHIGRSGSLGYKIKTPGSAPTIRDRERNRDYGSGFRHPSSVRAMQMRDEPVDDTTDDFTGRRTHSGSGSGSGHTRKGSRMSIYSQRSSGSTQTSPTKRKSSPLKSSRETNNSNLKTEFPLVLLHCTLLPPTLGAWSLGGGALSQHLGDEALLRELLPEVYWRRWKVLQEKVARNVEVKTRGVLIPHPKGEYEMLEERLLESLELERGRVREGHFWRGGEVENTNANGNGNTDFGFGGDRERDSGIESASASQTDEDDLDREASTKSQCPDCGKKVSVEVEMDRRWEVKVYAANGLMRAGAWNAAWSEMEKVDVEVGVWMPEEVRREIEDRIGEMGFGMEGGEDEHEHEPVDAEEGMDDAERRRREIYGTSEHDPHQEMQDKIDGLFDELHNAQQHHGEEPQFQGDHAHQHQHQQQQQQQNVDFPDLVLNYIKILAQDKRNVLIAFLSILVLFCAMVNPASKSTDVAISSARAVASEASHVQFVTTTVTRTSISTSTAVSVSVSTSTTTVLETPQVTESIVAPVESAEIEGEILLEAETETGEDAAEEKDDVSEAEEAPSFAQVIADMFVDDGSVMVD